MSKIKTTITTNEQEAICYLEIDPELDKGSEEYYKNLGIPVRYINKHGKKRLYALIPASKLDVNENEDATTKANMLNKKIDNIRRSSERVNIRINSHEVASLNTILENGFEPSLDNIDVAIEISKKGDSPADTTNIVAETETNSASNPDDDIRDFKQTTRHRGGYNAFSDLNSPEYIAAKNVLYSELHSMIDELEGEDLEIVNAIMAGVSERELADQKGVPRSTIQGHRVKLLARFKKSLGDFNI